MSSILKALKKLEDEKTSRVTDTLKIDSDILKSSPEFRKTSPLTLLLVLLLMFGGGAAAAFFIMRGAPPQSVTASAVPRTETVIAQNPPASPVIPHESRPVEPVTIPAAPVQNKTAVAAQKLPPRKVSAVIVKQTASPPSVNSHEKPVQAGKSLQSEPPAPAQPPTLRVNGIAFQNSSADSMAIVNGMPVSSGSTIEGATVEEIRRDRVVFQRNGEKFEIRQGQANR